VQKLPRIPQALPFHPVPRSAGELGL
jgi:hypothetical protein